MKTELLTAPHQQLHSQTNSQERAVGGGPTTERFQKPPAPEGLHGPSKSPDAGQYDGVDLLKCGGIFGHHNLRTRAFQSLTNAENIPQSEIDDRNAQCPRHEGSPQTGGMGFPASPNPP
jgi:hypothetical protein